MGQRMEKTRTKAKKSKKVKYNVIAIEIDLENLALLDSLAVQAKVSRSKYVTEILRNYIDNKGFGEK
jgi:metal-responsive CopG/Arc/MetJ family transcriptional regulator